jgi:hypothetical protein
MTTATLTAISNVHAADRLGDIRAQIAELKAVEEAIVSEVKSLGAGAHEGDAYRATVSEVADRETLDPKAMEAKLRELGVDGRWFVKNTKTVRGYVTVKVSARKA